MIKLIVDDFEQITTLEYYLTRTSIPFDIELVDKSYGIRPPYLIVDGVPLDFNRSLKWIREHDANG